jgi:hypothetical protein
VDWSEERYVRVYTRDTPDLLAFGFEGRTVWWELIRKVDRAGVLDHGGDLDIVAELLRVPVDVFRVGLDRIVKRGSARLTDRAIVIPGYLAAQEAEQSDRQRQRESRARRREVALATGATPEQARAVARPDRYGPPAEGSHDVTPVVTDRDPRVTRVTPRVTRGHSEPNRTSLSRAEPDHADGSTRSSPSATRRVVVPPDPDAFLLADLLRDAVIAVKPNAKCADSWTPRTRGAWAKAFAKLLRRRPRPALEAAIAFVREQSGGQYALVIESAESFAEKLDRLEIARGRAVRPSLAVVNGERYHAVRDRNDYPDPVKEMEEF